MPIKSWLKNKKIVFLLVLILLVALFPWRVQSGEETWCRFGHLVKGNVSAKWVPWWLSFRYQVVKKNVVCPDHLQAQRLLLEAEKEIDAGNYRRAINILKELVKEFPTPEAKEALARAQKALKEVSGASGESTSAGGTAGSSGNAGGSASSGSSSDDGSSSSSEPTHPLKKALLPDVLLYYKGGSLLEENDYISRAYLPPVEGDVQTMAITIYGLSSSSEAQDKFNLGESLFPDNGESLKIGGKPAYFGTFDVSAGLYVQYDNVIFEVISKGRGEPVEIKSYVKEVGEELIKIAKETWAD